MTRSIEELPACAEQRALLRSVIEAPRNHRPRLAYAAWLEGHGRAGWADAVRAMIDEAREWESDAWGAFALCDTPVPALWGLASSATVRGGFVEHVAMSAAAFVGVAAELLARQPILSVRLADREPEDARLGYGWHAEPEYEEGGIPPGTLLGFSSMLPRPLWDALQGGERVGGSGRCFSRYYGSSEAAHAALLLGCVNWGRSLVDPPLPPLEAPGDDGAG